jgi:hypothetical protein
MPRKFLYNNNYFHLLLLYMEEPKVVKKSRVLPEHLRIRTKKVDSMLKLNNYIYTDEHFYSLKKQIGLIGLIIKN